MKIKALEDYLSGKHPVNKDYPQNYYSGTCKKKI